MDDSISNADTDQAEEQLYAALDVDAEEGLSGGELYIVSTALFQHVRTKSRSAWHTLRLTCVHLLHP